MDADVIIIGGGLIGSTLALALARHEMSSIVVDAQDLDATTLPAFDGRASAVASASARMLRALGLGEVFDRDGCAISGIRVTDGTAPQFLHFEVEEQGDPLGIMLENRLLRIALLKAVRDEPLVTLIAPVTVEVARPRRGIGATSPSPMAAASRRRWRLPPMAAARPRAKPPASG